MEIRFSPRFRKQYTKSNQKIKVSFHKRLKIFEQNHNHPLLKNHSLAGNYKGLRSINITGDWRAVYREKRTNDKLEITFVALGTHSQLYG
ncbi:MAG: type II toxin-antitoxin system mRNA interferase toxin, RelE/StbE family [Candidatus Levybacteria bacterium]|nr:type II toxin-antitoxin system mRNA interferase toxin, RelE/StbE family [Candidatus Levybacteria bacterium]